MSAYKIATAPGCATSAILCHDILVAIFDHLNPGLSGLDDTQDTIKLRQTCREALASSAVACRTLSHHALDVLWREVDDIHPLLQVLPSYKRIELQATFSGAILPEHWSRFELYADRIRVIRHPPREGVFHPSVWMLLATRCRSSPLLPRLRKLIAPELRVSKTSALFLLVSPTLRAIDIHLGREEQEEDRKVSPNVAISLLQTLPLIAPDLEHFKLSTEFDLGKVYLRSFKDFSQLRTLSIPSNTILDEHMLHTISTITTLQELSCKVDLSGTPALSLPLNALRRLTKLDVTGHLDHLVTLIIACRLPNLTRLVLQITNPPRCGQPAASFAAICQRCEPNLLASFAALFLCKLGLPDPDSLVEYFEPLLAFPGIAAFHFYSFLTEPPIRDDDLARFGAAWPRLTTFQVERGWPFAQYNSSPDTPCPTLSGLVELARRCPCLRDVHLSQLDVRTLPEGDTSSLFRNHGLRSLTIQSAMLPSPEQYSAVASVLNHVFPEMSLEGPRPSSKRGGDGWKKVLRRLKVMRRGLTTNNAVVAAAATGTA